MWEIFPGAFTMKMSVACVPSDASHGPCELGEPKSLEKVIAKESFSEEYNIQKPYRRPLDL
jgi:hypothetical protein